MAGSTSGPSATTTDPGGSTSALPDATSSGEGDSTGHGDSSTGADESSSSSGGDPGSAGVAGQVFLGRDHACALSTSRTALRCWGNNAAGQLGIETDEDLGNDEDTFDPATWPAVQVLGNDEAGATIEQLALGEGFSCALISTGDVRCWGANQYGQLGNGQGSESLGDDPGELPSLQTVPLDAPAVHIAAGSDHACAVLEDGAVHCWGRNNRGQLGLGDFDSVGIEDTPASVGPVPVFAPDDESGATVTWVDADDSVTCVLTSANAVRCWGDTVSSDTAMLPYEYTYGDAGPDIPLHPSDADATPLGAYPSNLSICVHFDDQRLRCWGTNTFGVLGYGVDTNLDLPADTPEAGVPVLRQDELDAGVVIEQFVRDDNNFLALLSTGDVRSWGSDSVGETGHPEDDGFSVRGIEAMPDSANVGVVALEERGSVVGIAAGTANGCVVTDVGLVRCWGAVRQGVVPMASSSADGSTYNWGDHAGGAIADAPAFDPFAGAARR